MDLTVAVIAPGEMGAAIGGVLTAAGATVLTSLAGRSAASAARAKAAGLRAASDEEIAAADIVLSIVPPGAALALAERLAPALARTGHAVFADCNAVNPATVGRIAKVIAEAGCRFVDAGIVGPPPRPPAETPRIYTSGPDAAALAPLIGCGLDIRVLDGPVGAASALKMSYAGITKGMTAVGTTMILGAIRAGAGPELARELRESQGSVLARLTHAIPGMFPKAYRWVAEMEEIAGFLGPDDPASPIYHGAAGLYARIAADREGEAADLAALQAFLDLAKQ